MNWNWLYKNTTEEYDGKVLSRYPYNKVLTDSFDMENGLGQSCTMKVDRIEFEIEGDNCIYRGNVIPAELPNVKNGSKIKIKVENDVLLSFIKIPEYKMVSGNREATISDVGPKADDLFANA